MEDIQEQLAALRRRIARIDRKYADARAGPRDRRPARSSPRSPLIHRRADERRSGAHRRTASISRPRGCGSATAATAAWTFRDLAELPEDLLDPLSDGAIPRAHPLKWAFLDTETTGLAGRHRHLRVSDRRRLASSRRASACASSSCAITARRPSLLCAPGRVPGAVRRADHLQRQGLRSAAARNPLPHGARAAIRSTAWSTWICCSARAGYGSCAWKAAAWWIWRTGSWAWSAQGDLPGEMIPYCYFEYLRTQQAFRLVPIFHHNAHRHSVARLPDRHRAVRLPRARGAALAPRRGPASAWRAGCCRPSAHEEALRLFRRAVELGLPDHLLFRTLWDIAAHREARWAAKMPRWPW